MGRGSNNQEKGTTVGHRHARTLIHFSTQEEALAERNFLVERFLARGGSDYVGRSSNAMVKAALVGQIETDALPADESDLKRCQNTFNIAPAHLQKKMAPILERFKKHVAEETARRKEVLTAQREADIKSGKRQASYDFVQEDAEVLVVIDRWLIEDHLRAGLGNPDDPSFEKGMVLNKLLGQNNELALPATVIDADGQHEEALVKLPALAEAEEMINAEIYLPYESIMPVSDEA